MRLSLATTFALFVVLPVAADPALTSALADAAGEAAKDCVGDAVEGVEAAPLTDGSSVPVAFAACSAEFAARSAGAVIGWAATAAVLWWDQTVTTTTVPCEDLFGLNVVDGHQQTCYNFPAGSTCYTECCASQLAWCNTQSDTAACMKERACITPNILEFSAEQLFFVRDDMGRLNTEYNALVASLQEIDIAGMTARREWLNLGLACNDMLTEARRFIHIVHHMKDNVYCRSPGLLCEMARDSHDFELTSETDTCFNFLGPCYNTCCDVQQDYCNGHDQCVHDRGCREHNPPYSLQQDLCNDLTDCRANMEDAVGFIHNLKTCSTVLAAAAPGTSPCTKHILQGHYDQIVHYLDKVHDALVALESTAAGAPGTHLSGAPEALAALPQPQGTDVLLPEEATRLEDYAHLAQRQPFTVQRYNTSASRHTTNGSGWSNTALLGASALWTVLSMAGFYLFLVTSNPNAEGALGEALLEGGCPPPSGDDKTHSATPDTKIAKPEKGWKSSFNSAVALTVVAWLAGQLCLWWLSSPTQTHLDPQRQALLGHISLQDRSEAYWNTLSDDMSSISSSMNSLDQSSSCPAFLVSPLFSTLQSLFDTLTSMPQ